MCAWAPTLHLLTGSSFSSILRVILARHDLSGLDGAHLGDPRRTGLHLTNGAQLVAGVSGNANVVGALEDELEDELDEELEDELEDDCSDDEPEEPLEPVDEFEEPLLPEEPEEPWEPDDSEDDSCEELEPVDACEPEEPESQEHAVAAGPDTVTVTVTV